MAIARSKTEARKIAGAEVALKIRLSMQLKTEVSRLLKRICDDFYLQYVANGSLIEASNYEADLQGIFKNHYRRVARFFGHTTAESMPKHIPGWIETKDATDAVEALQNAEINRRAKEQARDVAKTTNERLKEAVDGVITAFLAAAQTPTQQAVADNAWRAVKEGIPGRSSTISSTETNSAAEAFKQIEVQYIAAKLLTYFLGKEWVSQLNEATRKAHGLADGQIVGVDECFIVGGEFLLTPGDRSHGASIANTINCYCTIVYRLFKREKTMEKETLEVKLLLNKEAKTEDEHYYLVEGYGSTHDKDLTDDIVAPGAFSESLKQHTPNMFLHHHWDSPIGVWDIAQENEKGLYLKGRIPKTPETLQIGELIKLGAFKGLSIGYEVQEYNRDTDTGVRTILKAKLWEVSLVTIPANPQAKITAFKGGKPETMRDLNKYLSQKYKLGRDERNDIIATVKAVVVPTEKTEETDIASEIMALAKDLLPGGDAGKQQA